MGLVYLHFDGDSVGDKLELLLLDNNLVAAKDYSRKISAATFKLVQRIDEIKNSKVLINTGDGVVAYADDSGLSLDVVDEIRDIFFLNTGCTMSCGIGDTPKSALQALRVAKLSGKNKMIKSPSHE